METVQAEYAKTHFGMLLEKVEHGQEMGITRQGKVIAKLVPFTTGIPLEASDRAFVDKRPATVVFEKAWALGGLDLPNNLSETSDMLSPDDIVLD